MASKGQLAGMRGVYLVAAELASGSYIYVLVSIREKPKGSGEDIQYFVVPSRVVKKHVLYEQSKTGTVWYSFMRTDAEPYRDKWSIFGDKG